MNPDILQFITGFTITFASILYTKGIVRWKYRRAIHEELDLLIEVMGTNPNENYTAYRIGYREGLRAALDRLEN